MQRQFQTLLQPYEVIELTNIDEFASACTIQNIRSVEVKEFRDCIGTAFYNALMSDLSDYTAVAAYESTTNYVIDDLVLFQGSYYICIQDATNITPSNVEYWQLAPKFTNPCYNDLWINGFMGRFLALSVLKRTVPYIETQVTAQGLTAPQGSNFVASSNKSVDRLVNAINTDVVTDYENMREYMLASTCDFSLADKIIKPSGCNCECGNNCSSGNGCLANKRKQTNPVNFW